MSRHSGRGALPVGAVPPDGPPTLSRGRTVSVRMRILSAVLVTAALGMIGAGAVSYLLSRHATYDGIARALSQENDEIATVSRLATDGGAGRAIEGPGDILYVAIKRSVPDPDEGIMGLVDGQVAWVPDSQDPFQRSLAADAELVAAAAAVPAGEPVRVRELSTTAHPALAWISVPVQVAGSAELGHYVAAVDVTSAMGPVNRTHLIYVVVCIVALGVVALVGWQVAGRLLSPLRTLRSTAQRITDTDLDERIPASQLSSRDEVADLGHTVNAMLDRLSLSFDTQRQMLDDAGHELRTPITIVRGHLELLDPHDPGDVGRTRDLAIDELDRMQRLVEELLTLAKAQRPDFVRLQPVAVDRLLYDVLDKVAALGERRWLVERAPEVSVPLDPQRITQALVQLVANAVRYTEPGAVVALGAALDAAALRLWVRDEGVGIPDAEQQTVFRRFARGSTRPAGADSGAGLGLSIVSAIATAHRGRVELASTPGAGSTFALVLPLPATVTRPASRDASSTEEPAWQPS